MWNFIIPAAIGAFTSAAMGRDPLKGAVMGGITGGLLGPAGGNLFNLGSSTAATAGTSAATGGATAFGASQAPSSLLASGVGSGATTGAISSGAAPLYNGPVSSTVGGIHTGAGISPESVTAPISKYASAINTSDPVQLAKAAKETTGQTFTDGIADQIMPKFGDFTQISEQATKTGGYEKPLYERAYDSIVGAINKDPLGTLGTGALVATSLNPRRPQQPVTGSGGSITKGTPPQQAGQILKVRRPTRFA